MNPTYPNGTGVKLTVAYGPKLPLGATGRVSNTIFFGNTEYCVVDFDSIPGSDTTLVLARHLVLR